MQAIWVIGLHAISRLRQSCVFHQPPTAAIQGSAAVLVYVTKGVAGKERLYVVRSLDEIDEIEAKLVVENAKSDAEFAQQESDWNARHPHLKTLQEQFSKSMAISLSYLLNDIRDRGLKAAKAGRPKAIFTRHLAKLKEVGLIE